MRNGKKNKKTDKMMSNNLLESYTEQFLPEFALVKEFLTNILNKSQVGGDGKFLPDTQPNENVLEEEKSSNIKKKICVNSRYKSGKCQKSFQDRCRYDGCDFVCYLFG